jgi:hypothetical protein
LQWGPTDFFAKISEIGLWRFSFRFSLEQGWPTQIGLWAAFGKISKNIDFLGQFLTKTMEKNSKYRKITEFQSKIGPQKFPSGPRVGHPCFRSHSSNPWKIREILKHLNWELFRKPQINLEPISILQSSSLESMQNYRSFQAICILSLRIWFEKRYLQFPQRGPMGFRFLRRGPMGAPCKALLVKHNL